jgi:hypothetical protein
MTGNLVESIAPYERWALLQFARDVQYMQQGGLAPSVLRAFMRGLRAEDTFASAMQQDLVAVVDAQQFTIVTGLEMPRRYDRLIAGSQSYAVQEWRPAPAVPPFVFFKILVRGSQQ